MIKELNLVLGARRHLEAHGAREPGVEDLAQLTREQRIVIERRYGLNAEEISTLEELARELKITRERVRQIQVEALASLRRILASRGLSRAGLL